MAWRANVFIEQDVRQAVAERAKSFPKRWRRGLGLIARGARAQSLIRALSTEPGRPKYPIRWKSQRQRRYVMMLLERRGELPYIRKHTLSRGWQFLLESAGQDADKGIFLIKNDAPETRYVQGADQQPYHIDTGWPAAEPLIREASPGFESDVIDLWYKESKLL